jgi:hypothetical protein
MKCNIKIKDFDDKANLEKSLSNKLKKPVIALKKKVVEKLPFCYEADYFSDGKGFVSIGIAKEIQKLFKTGRSKGQGKDENGKTVKIDKKKVAYGTVSVNEEGIFVFKVKGGVMKRAQAKKVIKSVALLKKLIGDNFIISKGEQIAETGDENQEKEKYEQPSDQKNSDPDVAQKKEKIRANMSKIKSRLEKISMKLKV